MNRLYKFVNNPISQKPVMTLKYKSSAEIQVCIIVTRQTVKCFCTQYLSRVLVKNQDMNGNGLENVRNHI